MANIRLIKRRIKGVQSTAKITRAMEMIATSKMRRAQDAGLAGRPYDQKIRQVIADLAAIPGAQMTHPLLQKRPVKKIAIIHITPDRGLCGGLNANLNRKSGSFIVGQDKPVTLICVGRKGAEFMHRAARELTAEFTNLGDRPKLYDVLPIADIVNQDYIHGKFDEVYLVYTKFITTMSQTPVIERLLPVVPETSQATKNGDFDYEPDAQTVRESLLPRFVEMEIYHAILESIASEQSARMVAMRNATENAKELTQDLTLMYNKARQEAITTELLDIAGGVAALQQ
ncbi:MAG: ATP synthase F1 subunit gamma [Dehalococcoidales bacterium]|nr:ATP synthase F1 subunit gamma [Dehalococcoidales bacterium]